MQFNEFKNIIFDRAEKEGFKEFELYYQNSESFGVQIFKGEIDKYTIDATLGVCFRGIYEGQMGYAYSEVMDDDAIDMLIEKAKENALLIEKESQEEIFKGEESYPEVNGYSTKIDEYDAAKKIAMAKELEKATYAYDERVESTQGCGIFSEMSNVRIVNSKGLDLSDKGNVFYSYIAPVVKDEKNVNNGFEIFATRNPDEFDAEKMAKNSVEDGLKYFNGSSISGGTYKVMFSKKAAASMLRTFSPVFNGEQAVKGMTLLKDKVSEKVASDIVNIKDSAVMEDGLVMRSFDDEGVSCREKNLIQNGVLNTLLHNRATAKKFEVESTGNGFKPSFSSPVSVVPTNLFLEKGEKNYEEMIKTLENGVIISSLQGMHSGASPVTGDFSLAAKGFLVENGKVVKPVEQITVAGNFFDMLKDVIEIGSDMYFAFGGNSSVGSPSIIINELSIAGE